MTEDKKKQHNKVKHAWGKSNDTIGTPPELYQQLDQEFHFDHDPCPLHRGDTTPDGLKSDWGKSNFVNPPFSEISKWLEKGKEEMKKGNKSVFLVTARTNTNYWCKYVWQGASEIRFVMGKIKFQGYKNGFPVPCCVVIYDPAKPGGNFIDIRGLSSPYRTVNIVL